MRSQSDRPVPAAASTSPGLQTEWVIQTGGTRARASEARIAPGYSARAINVSRSGSATVAAGDFMIWIVAIAVTLVVAIAIYDLMQRQHAILRTFPIIGHFRYWLEAVGPELRQYIVTDNNEERPFSRDQRRWIYASAKRENNYFGFGSDNEMELQPSYLIIKHDSFRWRPIIRAIRRSIRSSRSRAPR
jgi:hypothetical protein